MPGRSPECLRKDHPAPPAPAAREAAGGSRESYHAVRAAMMAAEAALRRLDLREREGALLDRARVEARVAAWACRLRDALSRWPAQIGAELAAALGVDEALLARHLEEHVHRLCRELAAEPCDLDA